MQLQTSVVGDSLRNIVLPVDYGQPRGGAVGEHKRGENANHCNHMTVTHFLILMSSWA